MRNPDVISVVEQGHTVESGRSETFPRRDGRYRDLDATE